jgi:hypothetical protein
VIHASEFSLLRSCSTFALAVLTLAGSATLLAHHSFAADYDINKPITVVGKVTRMRWSNPHAWLSIDMRASNGKVVNWTFELVGVGALYQRGWKQRDLLAGTTVTVHGWLARNGTPAGNASTVVLPDGRELWAAATPEEREPPD